MKYKEGNIVSLYDGRTVYIMSVDKQSKQYTVTETDDNSDELFIVSESEVFMLLVST
jgi:hypothetical protein